MKKILVVLALLSFIGVAFAAMSTGGGQPAGGDGATWHEGDKDKDWDKDKDKDKDWDREHHKKHHKNCREGTQYNPQTHNCVPCPKKCDFNGVCTTVCSSGGGGQCLNPPCSAVPVPTSGGKGGAGSSSGLIPVSASAADVPADSSNGQTASN
jgi:hypothetical protein